MCTEQDVKDMLSESYRSPFGGCVYGINCDEYGVYAHISNLYVYKEHRRQGHARQILKFVIDRIRNSGWTDEISIVAVPRENSIPLDKLKEFYKELGLKVFETYM